MPAPFPGMDPWLEQHWGDVHTSLSLYARDQIQPRLPRDLRARVEEYLTVESDDSGTRRYAPDVRVIERPDWQPLEVDAPTIVELVVEPRTLRSIHIVDTRSGHRIVTAIEFLSPGNKIGRENRRQYRRKRRDLLDGGANLVEIDLTRDGRYLLGIPQGQVPRHCRTPYRICVVRASSPERFELYPVPLQSPLPTIAIPLRPTDRDIPLALQPLIAQAWEHGAYDDIDYAEDPDPPLRGRDATWAEGLLRERGLRT